MYKIVLLGFYRGRTELDAANINWVYFVVTKKSICSHVYDLSPPQVVELMINLLKPADLKLNCIDFAL
jgi:hypothetical protein